MKITKSKLKLIIKEELQIVLDEKDQVLAHVERIRPLLAPLIKEMIEDKVPPHIITYAFKRVVSEEMMGYYRERAAATRAGRNLRAVA